MPAASPRRPGVVLVVLCSSGIVVSLQQSIVLPVLPQVTAFVGTAPENGSWLLTAGLLSGSIATPVLCRLADLHGRRRLLSVTLAALLVGSALGAMSATMTTLVIARVLQGTAVALIPIGIAIMRDALPSNRVPLGVAAMSATLAIGSSAALPLAGVLIDLWGWRSIFWPTLVLSALLLLLVPTVLPGTTERTSGRSDPVGAVLLGVALTGLLLALSKGASWGWAAPGTLAAAATGLVLLAAWVPFELRHDAPLVDLRAAISPGVATAHLTSFGLGFVAYTNMMTLPQMLQQPLSTGYGQGLSELAAGIWMIPMAASFGIAAPLAARLVRRIGADGTMAVGAFLMAVTYVVRLPTSSSLSGIVIGSTLVSVGTALTFAAMPILLMHHVPGEHTAAANGFNHLLRTIGSTAATALTAAVLAALVMSDGATPTFTGIAAIFWASAAVALVIAVVHLPRRSGPGRAGGAGSSARGRTVIPLEATTRS